MSCEQIAAHAGSSPLVMSYVLTYKNLSCIQCSHRDIYTTTSLQYAVHDVILNGTVDEYRSWMYSNTLEMLAPVCKQ